MRGDLAFRDRVCSSRHDDYHNHCFEAICRAHMPPGARASVNLSFRKSYLRSLLAAITNVICAQRQSPVSLQRRDSRDARNIRKRWRLRASLRVLCNLRRNRAVRRVVSRGIEAIVIASLGVESPSRNRAIYAANSCFSQCTRKKDHSLTSMLTRDVNVTSLEIIESKCKYVRVRANKYSCRVEVAGRAN